MTTISRRCIPYTPRRRELSESTFAIVTTAGVHLREQEPFPLEGDNSWREIPGEVQSSQLMVTHDHYDHRHADLDINCVFPIDRLRELAADGVIQGVSNLHRIYGVYTAAQGFLCEPGRAGNGPAHRSSLYLPVR